MEIKNNSIFAKTLHKLTPLFQNVDIVDIAGDTVWNIVLGVLPIEFKGREEELMDNNRKDSTNEKIDNIDQITDLAEYMITEKPIFEFSNIESFSYALRQLNRYVKGDSLAETSLIRFKKLYLEFMTSYFLQAVKNGSGKIASKNLKLFSDKILSEDTFIKSKLSELY